MRTIVVRYQTTPAAADENAKLVAAVYDELNAEKPAGFRYVTLRLDDGVTFVHILTETAEGGDSLAEQPAFQAFVSGVAKPALISRLSLFTISDDVPPGAQNPIQSPRVN